MKINDHDSSFKMEVVNIADPIQIAEVKELVWEYFTWGNTISIAKHGFSFDISKMLVEFLNDKEHYQKPDGILYLLRSGESAIGTGGFKKISEKGCELKRIYIRERFRRNVLGILICSE